MTNRGLAKYSWLRDWKIEPSACKQEQQQQQRNTPKYIWDAVKIGKPLPMVVGSL